MLENGDKLLNNWLAQSPDQNIIENLWDMLQEESSQRNMRELWATCKEEFEEISVDYIPNFMNRYRQD